MSDNKHKMQWADAKRMLDSWADGTDEPMPILLSLPRGAAKVLVYAMRHFARVMFMPHDARLLVGHVADQVELCVDGEHFDDHYAVDVDALIAEIVATAEGGAA